MKKADALWSISLDVECPYCHKEFDILNVISLSNLREEIFPLESGFEHQIYCPFCKAEFEFKTCFEEEEDDDD